MYVGEQGYLNLLRDIMGNGVDREDRTGTGTRSIFSAQMQFDLREGFPLLTTKKMATKGIVGELLWILNGDTDLPSLRWFTFGDKSCSKTTIWDANINQYSINEDGGRLYGSQWRYFEGGDDTAFDQVKGLLEEAKRNPTSRRLLVNAWNAAEINEDMMALPCCHFAWQVYIEDGWLDLKWNQRSSDLFLGVPFNISSYATLAHLLAKWLGLRPRMLVGDLTNVHIYHNHFDAVEEQLSRAIIPCEPTLILPDNITLDNLEQYTASDFVVIGYKSHPTIKAPMAV